MAFLLDTNVISELRRPKPEQLVLDFIAGCPLSELYLSSLSFAEIRFGIQLLPDFDRRAALLAWLTHEVRPMFAGRALELTEDIMLRWRFLVEEGRKRGRTYSQPDLMLAATALEHNLTMVTRNVKDYANLGMTVFNPWSELGSSQS